MLRRRFHALGLGVVTLSVQMAEGEEQLAFDVASIKPVPPRSAPRGLRINPGMMSGNATLKELVAKAYSIPEKLVWGGPPWADSEIYAIAARSGEQAAPD